MGEVQAAVPLVAALRARGFGVLLTSATPTGRQRAEQSCGPAGAVRYAPYDLPGAVTRVLRATRPRLLIVLETELWPNTLHACARAGVPVLAASARLSARTAGRLVRWPGLISAPALANLRVAAQTAADAERYRRLGVPAGAVRVCGNLKFDRIAAPDIVGPRPGAAPGARAGAARCGSPAALIRWRRMRCWRRIARCSRSARRCWCWRPGIRGASTKSRRDWRRGLAGRTAQRRSRRQAPTPKCCCSTPWASWPTSTPRRTWPSSAAAWCRWAGTTCSSRRPWASRLSPGRCMATAPEVFAALRAADAVCVAEDAAALPGLVTRLLADPAGRGRLAANAAAVLEANRGSLVHDHRLGGQRWPADRQTWARRASGRGGSGRRWRRRCCSGRNRLRQPAVDQLDRIAIQ